MDSERCSCKAEVVGSSPTGGSIQHAQRYGVAGSFYKASVIRFDPEAGYHFATNRRCSIVTTMRCSQCDIEFPSAGSLANHVRWKHKRAELTRQCKHCDESFQSANLGQHEKSCVNRSKCKQCGELTKNKTFCSSNCSAVFNNSAGKTGYAVYRKNNDITRRRTYRDICFENWDESCAICGWSISVDVHHVDDNHRNDNERNLIPLCQNHHTMTRMIEHKNSIREQIDQLVENKFGALVKRDHIAFARRS